MRYEHAVDLAREHAGVPMRFSDSRLDNFSDGIVAPVREWLDTRQWDYELGARGLYIWGDVGSGKTHLAAAVANALCNIPHDAYFAVVSDVLVAFQESFRAKDNSDAKELWGELADAEAVLVLDDFGAEYVTEWARAKLYQLVNQRYNNCAATVVTSNLSPKDLAERIGDRTVSRLMHGATVIHLTGKDRRLGDAPGG